MIQAPHPEAIQTVSAQNGGFKRAFFCRYFKPKRYYLFLCFLPQFVSITPQLNLSLTLLTLTWIVLDFLTLSFGLYLFRRLSNSHLYPKILGLCGGLLLLIALYGLYQSFI